MTCAGREHFLPYLKANLPAETLWCFDDTGGAMGNFLKMCGMAGDGALVQLEDDIRLTVDFEAKARAVIRRHQFAPIQFFSMRKADLTIGSRWEPGRSFMMNQCCYMPPGMPAALVRFYDTWGRKAEHPTAYDMMMADFMASRRIRYFLHVPSLVDHRPGKSAINPRRATNRQSLTFRDPIPED